MALTQAQQQLADIAQAGEANACCLALGGDIIQYGDQELCSFVDTEYPLGMACGQITASLPSMPSPNGNGQGNFLGGLGQGINNLFGFVGENFQELAQTYQNLTGGNQQGQTGNTTIIVQPEDDKPDRTVLYIVGGAILLLVTILLIRKMRK